MDTRIMTARPEFGDAIAVGGECPGWLPNDVYVRWYNSGMTDEWWSDRWPQGARAGGIVEWSAITAIRLEVPRYDFVYLALERGMVPWFGGDEAPKDWDEGVVLFRNGRTYKCLTGRSSSLWLDASDEIDIIGYTRKATSTALPLAHPAAPQGEEDEAPCTDCEGTGWTIQTERRCSCQGPTALMRKGVTLADASVGLFWCGETLALKTEYGNNEGRIDAYIVSSGEFFWGPAPQSIASQRATLVTPIDTDAALAALAPAAIASGREGVE